MKIAKTVESMCNLTLTCLFDLVFTPLSSFVKGHCEQEPDQN